MRWSLSTEKRRTEHEMFQSHFCLLSFLYLSQVNVSSLLKRTMTYLEERTLSFSSLIRVVNTQISSC